MKSPLAYRFSVRFSEEDKELMKKCRITGTGIRRLVLAYCHAYANKYIEVNLDSAAGTGQAGGVAALADPRNALFEEH